MIKTPPRTLIRWGSDFLPPAREGVHDVAPAVWLRLCGSGCVAVVVWLWLLCGSGFCVALAVWLRLCGSGCVALAVRLWQCGPGCVAPAVRLWLCGCGCVVLASVWLWLCGSGCVEELFMVAPAVWLR